MFCPLSGLKCVCMQSMWRQSRKPQEVQGRHALPLVWEEMSLASPGIREKGGAELVPCDVRQNEGDGRHSVQSERFLQGW